MNKIQIISVSLIIIFAISGSQSRAQVLHMQSQPSHAMEVNYRGDANISRPNVSQPSSNSAETSGSNRLDNISSQSLYEKSFGVHY